MTYRTKTISIQSGYEERAKIFWFMIIVLACLSLVQIYAINSTTKNVAERQVLEKEVLELTTRTGALEFSYIELRNKVDIELAHNMGFEESKDLTYVSRISSDFLGTFTLNR